MTLKFEGIKAKWNFHTVLNLELFSKVRKYENKYRTKICDFTYTINPEPECLPADKNAEGVVKPEPQARVLPRPRHFYPPVNTRCEGFIMLIIYSFLYFKEETNAFHYQKVATFLYRKSVERECRWKGTKRCFKIWILKHVNKICNNAGYQPTIQELLPETSTPWVVFRLF